MPLYSGPLPYTQTSSPLGSQDEKSADVPALPQSYQGSTCSSTANPAVLWPWQGSTKEVCPL